MAYTIDMEKRKLLLWLFGVSLYISAFTFGGGYVVIPMVRKFFVQKKQLMTEKELLNIAAFAQSSPGAIAVNTATLAGYHVAKFPGILVSYVGTIIPPIVILTVISINYTAFRDNVVVAAVLKGMEAGVAAVIVDFVIDMCKTVFGQKRLLSTILIPATFVACFLLHINVALILIVCVALSIAESLLRKRGKGGPPGAFDLTD